MQWFKFIIYNNIVGHPSQNFHGTGAYNQYICILIIHITRPCYGSDVWRAQRASRNMAHHREAEPYNGPYCGCAIMHRGIRIHHIIIIII